MQVSNLESSTNYNQRSRLSEEKSNPKESTEKKKDSEGDVSLELAQKIADLLQQTSGRSLRFIVRDPASNGINNVVIEILNGQDVVIATIPSREIIHLTEIWKLSAKQAVKGLIVQDVVI